MKREEWHFSWQMSKPFCQSTATGLLLALSMTPGLAAQLRRSWIGRKGTQDPCRFYTSNCGHCCLKLFYLTVIWIMLWLCFAECRHWAVLPCASCFIAVACFYGLFLWPRCLHLHGSCLEPDGAVAVLYIVLNSLPNSMMFTPRNKDVKAALSRFKS